MIIQEKVEVKITNRNRNFYKNLNYIISGEKLIVYVKDLPKVSNVYVDVKCDICSKESNVSFCNYQTCFFKYNLYTCKKCSIEHKTKITNLVKYGVDNPLKSSDILNKVKETNLVKYGNCCPLLSIDVIKKTKETNFRRYGVEYGTQSDKAKQKRKETNILKYGVDNIFKSDDFKNKLKQSKIKDGIIISDYFLDEWKIYRNEVRRVTRIFKEDLFKNWNGYDFYDGEYIKDYFKLHHNNKKFPTIDHKISLFEGFIKKISPDQIGHIYNLVITKRSINSKKSNSFYYEYL